MFQPKPHHSACQMFRELTTTEFQELVDDMRTHGQRVSIKVFNGSILDGRSRQDACQVLGIDPVYEEWDGTGSVLDYIYSLNYVRRNLSAQERAFSAAYLVKNASPDAQVTQIEAAEAFGSSRASVHRATVIIEKGISDLQGMVEDLQITLGEGEQISRLPKGRQKRAVKRIKARGRDALKSIVLKNTASEVKKTNLNNKATCLLCHPGIEANDSAFKVHLVALMQKFPQYKGYLIDVIEEMGELETSGPVRASYDLITDAIRDGFQQRVQIKQRTKLADEVLDAGLGFLLEYGHIGMVPQGGKSEVGRGKRKDLYVLLNKPVMHWDEIQNVSDSDDKFDLPLVDYSEQDDLAIYS